MFIPLEKFYDVSFRSHNMQNRVRSRNNPYEIFGRYSSGGTVFLPGPRSVTSQHYSKFCFPPVSTIPALLNILFPLSVPLHQYSIFCSPCQYHSTNTLYSGPPVSTIPPILYILFPPVSNIPPIFCNLFRLSVPFHQYCIICFRLSVPFHHYSIFCFPCQYHSTNTLYSVPPHSTIPPTRNILFPLSVPFHQYSIFWSPCQYHSTNTLYSVSPCQ